MTSCKPLDRSPFEASSLVPLLAHQLPLVVLTLVVLFLVVLLPQRGGGGDGGKGGAKGGGGYARGFAGRHGAEGGRWEKSYWVHSLGPAVSNCATSYQMSSTCSCKTRSGAQLLRRHHL